MSDNEKLIVKMYGKNGRVHVEYGHLEPEDIAAYLCIDLVNICKIRLGMTKKEAETKLILILKEILEDIYNDELPVTRSK